METGVVPRGQIRSTMTVTSSLSSYTVTAYQSMAFAMKSYKTLTCPACSGCIHYLLFGNLMGEWAGTICLLACSSEKSALEKTKQKVFKKKSKAVRRQKELTFPKSLPNLIPIFIYFINKIFHDTFSYIFFSCYSYSFWSSQWYIHQCLT